MIMVSNSAETPILKSEYMTVMIYIGKEAVIQDFLSFYQTSFPVFNEYYPFL